MQPGGIVQSLKDGLRTDKIVGACQKCKSDLIIRRGHRGSRFIGCSGYPECRFTLPLPRSGSIVLTDKVCDEHGMFHIRIINKGKRPWDLGCPHCNFLEWQAKKALEKTESPRVEAKPKKMAKPAARSAKKAKTASPAKGDGLGKLPGVGPKTLEKLLAAGITTSEDLLGAKTKALSSKTGLSEKKILAWKNAAKALN